MSSPFPDKFAEAVKSLGNEMKDAIEHLSKKFEGAIATLGTTLGEEVERLSRMARGAQATVQFEAEASTEMGESVYVVGNHPSLGNWVTEGALALEVKAYPIWSAKFDVPADAVIEYKYVRKNGDGSYVWESTEGNRVITAPHSGVTVTHDQVRWS